MKILAIRLENLASLAGRHEVDLASGPLADAGLFAITGPTGSGKTTILDAMCLALFGETPRTAAASGDKWGAEGAPPGALLSAQDVRTLLHRGASAGWAEVDFVGADGKRLRARWSVHRAGDSAAGNLQKSKHQLTDLETGVALGSGRPTDTKSLIEARLGLTFEQFCRSVLLAQGEFAAFLKANSKEDRKDRAVLLEKMTGTGIYRDISRVTHLRCAEEAGKLQALEGRHGLIQPLSDEERASLEAHLAAKDAERRTLEVEHDETRATLGWYRVLLTLEAELEEAAKAHDEATRSAAAASLRRAHLARVKRAHEELRHPLEQVSRAVGALQESQARLVEAEAVFQRTAARRGETEAERVAAARRLEAARQAREAAQPTLQQARVQDDKLTRAAMDLSKQQTQVESAAAKSGEAEQRLQEAERALGQVTGERAAAETFLSQHPELEPVAAQWPHLEHQLRRVETAHRETAGLQALRPGLQEDVDDTGAVFRESDARWSALRADAARAHDRRKALDAERDEVSDTALRAELRTLDEELRRLDALERAEAAQTELTANAETVQSDVEARLARIEDTAAREAKVTAMLVGTRAALQEAEATTREIEKQHALVVFRHDLAPGIPCPLCGATEHPYRCDEGKTDAALATLLDRQRHRVDELLGRQDDLRAESEQHRVLLTADSEQLRASLTRLAGLADHLAKKREAADEAAGALEWSLEVDLDDPIGDRVSVLTRSKEALYDTLAAVEHLAKLIREATETEDHLRQQADAARSALERARDSAEAARQAIAAHEALSAEQAKVLTEARALLEPVLGHHAPWLVPLSMDPGALLENLAIEVGQWQEATQGRDSLDTQIVKLRAEHEGAQARLVERLGTEAEVREAHTAAAADLAGLQAARALLLDGKPADEVESALASRVRDAEAALESADLAAKAASDTATRADQLRNDLTDRARDAQTDLERALTTRGAALAAFTAPDQPVSVDDAQTLLAPDRAWILAESAAIQVLEQTLAEASIRLADRRARHRAHLVAGQAQHAPAPPVRPGAVTPTPGAGEGPSGEPVDAAERVAALNAAEAAQGDRLSALLEAIAAARQGLLTDDARRAQATALLNHVASQRTQVELWSRLDDLIGSADGFKLPLFAQQLTFEALLVQANVHLADLCDRYLLQRNPHVDLELQIVDRMFADEIRPVSSLSGGETFLVSLALALALASLSSRGVHVGSLFVDEGFGTLDPDTLESALAALDQLRTGGRQVGIISHVEGLADRVGARVEILPQGGGRSSLRCLGPGGAGTGIG